jgi:hypothetical protein
MTEHVARGEERTSASALEHLLTIGMEGVQLVRVEALTNPLLVYIHLFCCCTCHLSWWLVRRWLVVVVSINKE